MEMKAKLPRRRYKDDEHWLDAVYRNNKQRIDSMLSDMPKNLSKRNIFKNEVKDYRERQGVNLETALNRVSRSEKFTEKWERYRDNALSGIRSDPSANKKFSSLMRDKKGRFISRSEIRERIKYDKWDGIYTFKAAKDGKEYAIIFSNSPHGTFIVPIEYYINNRDKFL